MKNKNMTIIIPLHKIDEQYEIMVNNALASIESIKDEVNVMVVGPKEVLTHFENKDIMLVENEGETTYQAQVNLGVSKVETEYFSILEVDDTYNPIWYSSMQQAIKENPEVGVFLPIIKNISTEGSFFGFSNEPTWSYGFSEQIGYLDIEALNNYPEFQLCGGVFKTEDVMKCGGLYKTNIEVTFNYETLLRLMEKEVKVMTVPRIGYTHVIYREDSLIWSYRNGEDPKISVEDFEFWLKTATEEYKYTEQREIVK